MYGTIAYWVLQRTRELGIRRALGAPIGNIVWIVIGRGLAFASAGLAVGIVGSIALTRFIQSFLFHVSPTDPLTFASVTLLHSRRESGCNADPRAAGRARRSNGSIAHGIGITSSEDFSGN